MKIRDGIQQKCILCCKGILIQEIFREFLPKMGVFTYRGFIWRHRSDKKVRWFLAECRKDRLFIKAHIIKKVSYITQYIGFIGNFAEIDGLARQC